MEEDVRKGNREFCGVNRKCDGEIGSRKQGRGNTEGGIKNGEQRVGEGQTG